MLSLYSSLFTIMVKIQQYNRKYTRKKKDILINLTNTQISTTSHKLFKRCHNINKNRHEWLTGYLAIKASKRCDNCTLGNLISNISLQSLIIFILDVLNIFINERLTVKSRDQVFLLDNEQTSQPYSKIGIHFWRVSCKNTSSGARRPLYGELSFMSSYQ